MAWFPGMDAAREAISSLGESGIEAANISLLGAPAAQAAANTDVRDADARVTEYVAKRAVVGALVGAAGGGFACFLFGGLAFAIAGTGSALGLGVWVVTACGAVLGGAIGVLIGGESALDIAEGWELTFHPVEEGNVLVTVHSDDRYVVDRASEILETKHPRQHGPVRRRGQSLRALGPGDQGEDTAGQTRVSPDRAIRSEVGSAPRPASQWAGNQTAR